MSHTTIVGGGAASRRSAGVVRRRRSARRRPLVAERLESRAVLAAAADLTAFRPVAPFFNDLAHPVAEAWETDPVRGPGIRTNGDDDNGNRRPDYLDSMTRPAGDDDLVRVAVEASGTSAVVSWTGPLKAWTTSTKQAAVANGGAVSDGQTLWIEYVSAVQSSGEPVALTLTVVDATTDSTASDMVAFHRFSSLVVAIGGNTQDPGRAGEPGLGIFEIAEQLYDSGQDVRMFAHGAVKLNGRGAAYDEVVRAVSQRNVDDVAIVGYSWGGGATRDLAAALQSNRALRQAGYRLAYSASIDGIRHGSISSETRLPPGSLAHDNLFQRRDPLLRGAAVVGAWNLNVNDTVWGAELRHTTIDDADELQALIVDRLMARFAGEV